MTAIKIVDNKKLSMTEDEWNYFNQMCRSYDRPNFKGEELAKGLFESDDNGLIIFIKPPTSRFSSLEVFLFIVALFEHQSMRQMRIEFNNLVGEVRAAIQERKVSK